MAVGYTIAFLENGIVGISASDSSFTGGAPGIMAFGSRPGRQLVRRQREHSPFPGHYKSTDSKGIQSYQVISSDNGYGPQVCVS